MLAVAVIYGAWTMDRLELREIHPLSAPGLTPGLLGIALAVASRNADRHRRPKPGGPRTGGRTGGRGSDRAEPGAAKRLVISAALCLVYALGLVGRMPFWLATTLFVHGFHRRSSNGTGGRPIAGGCVGSPGRCSSASPRASGFRYVFSDLFLVRLP